MAQKISLLHSDLVLYCLCIVSVLYIVLYCLCIVVFLLVLLVLFLFYFISLHLDMLHAWILAKEFYSLYFIMDVITINLTIDFFLISLSLSQENVGGGGCDECKSGTFGLWRENPAGCSPCFCFGVSSICEELGGLVRVPVSTFQILPFLRCTIWKEHCWYSCLSVM